MLEEAIVQMRKKEQASERMVGVPKEDDLKTAAKALAECEYKLEISVRQLGEQQSLRKKKGKNLDQIRIKVRELVQKHI